MAKRVLWDEMIETDEILETIKRDGRDYFLRDRKRKIQVGIYLEHLMEERGISRKEAICKLNLEESYGRKLFGGRRIPTRKILLQSAFLLSLNLKETQRLLEIGRKPRLYPKIRGDAAIIHGIEKKMTLEQVNAFLEEIGEEPLFMMHEEFEEKYRKSLENIQFPKALRNHIKCVCCLKESRDNCTLLVTDGERNYVLKMAEGSRGASLEREKDIMNELEQAGIGMVPASVFFLKEEKTVYYMREYVEGDNLLAVVKRHGCMGRDTLVTTALQLCELLEILHSQVSIVHGDMKPENIICKKNHRFILIDFETARRLKNRELMDFSFDMWHREQAEHSGRAGADCRTDIYGLGITLLYLACGSYDRKDLRASGIPLGLQRIIRKCLAYNPRKSYRNVEELRKTLLRYRKYYNKLSIRHRGKSRRTDK